MAISRVAAFLAVNVFLAASAEAQIFNPQPTTGASTVQPASADLATSQNRDEKPEQSRWPSIPLPKITMPKVTMPKVTMPDMSTLFAPVRSGYGKVKSGTRKAWTGTKEMLSFGQSQRKSTNVPHKTGAKLSFWERLVGREPQPAGPQTVAEWMSQPRLDP